MQRPKAKGKKLGFFKDVLKLPQAVQTEGGPSDLGILMNKARVNRVVEKMVRGFYFHHFAEPLGEVDFEIEILSSINPKGNRQALLRSMGRAFESPTWAQNFGPDTHVVCALAEDDNRAGVWAFKLMGQHIVVAIVSPRGYFEKHQLR